MVKYLLETDFAGKDTAQHWTGNIGTVKLEKFCNISISQ